MKSRFPYIDVAKGMLIIMVICSHFELLARLCYQIGDETIVNFSKIEQGWLVFFMPAFFYITGYCTNFKKSLGEFTILGIKTILVPGFIINLSINLIEYIQWGQAPLWILKTITKSVLLQATGEWFLPSLFFGRLILWWVVRIKERYIRLGVSFTAMIVGLGLYNYFPQILDWWYFKHSLMIVIFMLIGYEMKNRTIPKVYYIVLAFLLLLIGTICFGERMPRITNKVVLSYTEIPLFLVLSLSGIVTILELSKKIGHNKLLEYFGRNSLVFYLLHFVFYRILLFLTLPLLGRDTITSIFTIGLVLFTNIILCCISAYLLNRRCLKWILGK